MSAALHRAAKEGNPRRAPAARRAPPRSGAHASRWADDELATRARRSRCARLEHRAWRTRLGGGSRVGVSEHYGFDAHGNITFLTDASGAVTDSYDYDAWGILVASTGSTLNTRRYAGEELDPDLGLINLRARQYKPGTGRFLTLDPVVGQRNAPLSFNRYLYAHGNPIDLNDPTGRSVFAELLGVGHIGLTIAAGALVAYNGVIAVAASTSKVPSEHLRVLARSLGIYAAIGAALLPTPVASLYSSSAGLLCLFGLASEIVTSDHSLSFACIE